MLFLMQRLFLSSMDITLIRNSVQKCLMKLLYDKTVVYATHQLEFLESADLILVSY